MIFMKKDLMELLSGNKAAYCCLSVESRTFKSHVQFICNSHTTTVCARPTSPGIVLAPSKMAKYSCQLMRTKSKLQNCCKRLPNR